MKKISSVIAFIGITAMIIIGLLNFDLMLEIWVKVFIGVIFIGFIAAAVKQFSV